MATQQNGHNGHNGHQPCALDAARALLQRNIMPVPVPYGTKNPNRPRWQDERYDAEHLDAFTAVERVNVGMRLGHIVGADGTVYTDKFCEVDLDTVEAVRAAPFFLPPTGMLWGRPGNPRSHYGYRLASDDGAKTVQSFDDPLKPKDAHGKVKANVCEIRYSGQTLAPGSVNAEGHAPETVRWEPDGDGDPAAVEFAALQRAVNRVFSAALLARYWAEGVRHLTALPLAGMLCRGGLSETDAAVFVRAVCVAAGESDADTQNRLGCVRDTYAKAAAGQPYTASPTLEEHISPQVVAVVRKALALKRGTGGGDIGPDGFALSDIGNAERFVARYEGNVLYCDDQNQFYIYVSQVGEGTVAGQWMPDRQNRVLRMAVQLVNEFRARCADRSASDLGNATQDQCDRHVREWSRTRNINAMLALVKAYLPVTPEEFDANDDLLNVRNGTVVLNPSDGTHYVRAASAADLLTKLWNARYQPDAVHPGVDRYRAMFVPEEDRWAFIEEAVGYSLRGGTKRYNFQLLGPSHAGKSMLLRILTEQGGGYATALKYNALRADERGGDHPRTDLAALRGMRLVTVTEVPQGASFDTDLFNTMLSGGDRTSVRGAYERRMQYFTYTHTLWTSGNAAYGVKGDNDAAYTRIHVVQMEHPLPETDWDDDAENAVVDPDRADTTADAFLACWLRGFARLYGEKGGKLTPPASVRAATRAVQTELDPLEQLLDGTVFVTGRAEDRLLKVEVNTWAKSNALKMARKGDGPWRKWGYKEQERFDVRLTARGARVNRSDGFMSNKPHWEGVRWAYDAEAPGAARGSEGSE